MRAPEGFARARAHPSGWLPNRWNRQVSSDVSHRLFYDDRTDRWSAGIHLASPGRVVPELAYDPGGIGNVYPVVDRMTLDAALAWFDTQRVAGEVAQALITGSSRWVAGPVPSMVVAVLTRAAADDFDGAADLLVGLRDLDTVGVDWAERAADLLDIGAPVEIAAPADAADILATISGLLAGTMSVDQAQRLTGRWLRRGQILDRAVERCIDVIHAIRVPTDDDSSVARWRAELEEVRTVLRRDLSGVAPSVLSSVGTVAGWKVRESGSAPVHDRSFELHAAFCVYGVPGGGRKRVEMFFDDTAFPVWVFNAGMCSPAQLGLSADLAADLLSLAALVDRPAAFRRQSPVVDRVDARFRALRDRLESETGLAAALIYNWGNGDSSCPTPRCEGTAP